MMAWYFTCMALRIDIIWRKPFADRLFLSLYYYASIDRVITGYDVSFLFNSDDTTLYALYGAIIIFIFCSLSCRALAYRRRVYLPPHRNDDWAYVGHWLLDEDAFICCLRGLIFGIFTISRCASLHIAQVLMPDCLLRFIGSYYWWLATFTYMA